MYLNDLWWWFDFLMKFEFVLNLFFKLCCEFDLLGVMIYVVEDMNYFVFCVFKDNKYVVCLGFFLDYELIEIENLIFGWMCFFVDVVLNNVGEW